MNGACHCGRVTIGLPARPAFLNACNCSLCLKSGALWGDYPESRVEIAGETLAYRRADVARPRLCAHFCGRCGATTHWTSIGADAADRAGINMRLFDPAALAGIELRYGDRRHHERGSYRAPAIFDGLGDQT